MATPAQQLASRANGALSHGPSSVEGKAISSRNSLKLGISAESMIIPGEDSDLLDQLTAEYHDQFQPVGPVETATLHDAIRAQWMRNRYYRIETAVLNMRAAAHQDSEHALAAAFEQDAKSGNTLQRLFRRQQAADRDWRSALQLLEQLQNRRRHEAAAKEMEALAVEQLAREAAVAAALPANPRVRSDNPFQVSLPDLPPGAPSKVNLALRLAQAESRTVGRNALDGERA